MTKSIGHFVNGARIAGASGRSGDIFNPATGEKSGAVALPVFTKNEKPPSRPTVTTSGRPSPFRSATAGIEPELPSPSIGLADPTRSV